MSKYDPLQKYLEEKGFSHIPMTFSQIESIIDGRLPPSARKHRAWWSNNPSNSVITYAWLGAGYRSSEVNLEGEKVVFLKDGAATAMAGGGDDAKSYPSLFGALKGTVRVAPGTDLTEPADPEWGKVYD